MLLSSAIGLELGWRLPETVDAFEAIIVSFIGSYLSSSAALSFRIIELA
jgi:hypothetical protein